MAVTIKDVAARAGVSPSTVSRACKDSPSISRETKEKVRRAMAELGYESSSAASNSEDFAKTIGIILPPTQEDTYQNPFFLEVIRGISQYCNEHRYVNTIITGQDDAEVLETLQSMRDNRQADAFIVLFSRKDDPIVEYLYNEGLLYVLLGKVTNYVNQTICVDNDNLSAAREATEYLIQLGHKRIAYLGSSAHLFFSSDRKNGYQLALMQNGLPVLPEYCLEVSGTRSCEAPLRQLFALPESPTAILVSDDLLAVSLKLVCMDLGIRIPEELSVIAFNNSLFSQMSVPPLSSIDVCASQLGVEAANQMINHIENPNLHATKIIVPYHIIHRRSCAAPPAEKESHSHQS